MPYIEDDVATAFVELEKLEAAVEAQRAKIGSLIQEALQLGSTWPELVEATGQTKARLQYHAKRGDPAYQLARQLAKEEELARNREATAAVQPGISVAELAERVGASRASIYNKINGHLDGMGPLVIQGWQLTETPSGRRRFIPFKG